MQRQLYSCLLQAMISSSLIAVCKQIIMTIEVLFYLFDRYLSYQSIQLSIQQQVRATQRTAH